MNRSFQLEGAAAARRAHTPDEVGSIPTPATKLAVHEKAGYAIDQAAMRANAAAFWHAERDVAATKRELYAAKAHIDEALARVQIEDERGREMGAAL